MKIIDSNGRLFGKISIIDLLAVLVVLILVAAQFVKTNHKTITSTTKNDIIIYQVKVTAVKEYIADALHVDDLVFDVDTPDSGGSLGQITDIQVLPSEKVEFFQDGTILENVSVPETVNLIITIKGEGQINGKTYMLNRIYPLGVNANRNLCTKYAQFTGVIYDILT